MKAGAHDYIMKNNMKRLLPAIERELREAKNRAERKVLEQKQKEAEALKLSEEKFKNLVSDMHVGVLLISSLGEILLVNTEVLELLELSEDQILGKKSTHPKWNVICEKGNAFQGFPTLFRDVISSGQPIRNYILGVDRPLKGDRVWLFVDAVPQFNSNGELFQVLWTFIDRTERKNAIDALRESEKRYRQLIEMSPDSIAIHQQGKIVYINSSGARQFGAQNPREMIGKAVFDLVHPDYRGVVAHRIEKTLKGEKVPYTEEKFIKLDGTFFDVEVTAIPSSYEDKPATQVIVRDITKRKQAEDEIKLKNEQLTKLNYEKDKFFSIIAHDLRSPFSSFIGITELLVERTSSFSMDKLKMIAADMRVAANNLYQLLENLLEWAKMQQGLFPFNPKLVNLLKIVNESISVISNPAKEKNIDINCVIPDNLLVRVDINMFQTIIRNLVSNAIKFTPKEGKISIHAKTIDKNSIELSITDTGIGMNETMVNNLFQLNARVNRIGTEGEPSSGLGLLLCKEFIEKHNGKIWVKSEEGKGTTFFIAIYCN
jgi:PAS domain S-box-containing protein